MVDTIGSLEVKDFPEIQKYLDTTDNYKVSLTRHTQDGEEFLALTQTSDVDGDLTLFRKGVRGYEPVPHSALTKQPSEISRAIVGAAPAMVCQPSPATDQTAVYNYLLTQVDVFKSNSGPGGGNLACVWTVRHIAHNVLKRWITETDSTAKFGDQLQRCYARKFDQTDIAPGGIIISPTMRQVGHVGFLGAADSTLGRLIYSNSSGDARFEQNYTLGKWIKRYRDTKGLAVLFYPLPKYVSAAPTG